MRASQSCLESPTISNFQHFQTFCFIVKLETGHRTEVTMKEVKAWGLGRARAQDGGGTLAPSRPGHRGVRWLGVPVSCTRSPGSLGLGPHAEKEGGPRAMEMAWPTLAPRGVGREDAIPTGQKLHPCLWRQVRTLKVWRTGGTCDGT